MRFVDKARYFLRSVLRARRMDAELDEELRDHLARGAEERMRHGSSEPAAHREAAVALGGVTRYAEEARDARGWRWLGDAATDVRYASRLAKRYPGYALATILITALGIGATTMVFSAVNGVLLRPLPFASPDQIVMLKFTAPDGRFAGSGLESFRAIAQDSQIVAAAGAYGLGTTVMIRGGEPQHALVEYLTPSALAILGVTPAIGRGFTADDADRDIPVVLLSHALWRERFGGDSTIVGRTIQLDDVVHTIVGVMSADFLGIRLQGPVLWLPARLTSVGMITNGQRRSSGAIVLRLAAGVTRRRAEAWLTARLHPRVADPIGMIDSVAGRVALQPLMDAIVLDRREPILILLGAVGLVLVLVAANVATLGLARAMVREREMAVGRAGGAGRRPSRRWRQVRQVLTETLLLMLAGGGLGVLFARLGVSLFVSAGVDILPRLHDIRLDWHVLVFAGALTLVAGLAAGAAPAMAASGVALSATLKGAAGVAGGGRRGKLRAALVVVEVAVSVVLLIGAGLLMKGFLRVLPSAPGFAADHRISVSVTLGDVPGGSADSANVHRLFVGEVLRRVTAIRGVRDAAATSFVPLLLASAAMYPIEPEGSGGARAAQPGYQRAVTPNYFPLMNIPLTAGREFTDADDRGGNPVTIVNETAAKRWWPGGSPIGKHLTWGRVGTQRTTAEVVGVVHNIRFAGTDTSHMTEFYVPYAQVPYRRFNFVVWTVGDPHLLIRELKDQIWAVNAKLPIDNVETLDDIIGDSVKEERLYVTLIGAFATIALVLAAAGIFSVLAYAVSQRTREIGIRLALGAPRASVGGLVIRQGAIIAGLGLGIGVVAARLLTHFLQSLLLLVSPTDTGVFIGTIGGLAVVALAACAIPLRRALSVDPVRSLRAE